MVREVGGFGGWIGEKLGAFRCFGVQYLVEMLKTASPIRYPPYDEKAINYIRNLLKNR